jgi:hypothetical protein
MNNFNFDIFTNSNPNLINRSSNNKLIDLININTKRNLFDDIINFIFNNKLLIIVIIVIIIILIWRYKYVNKNKLENFLYDEGYEKDKNGNVIYTYDEMGNIIARPVFNPNIPINSQHPYIKYLPDEHGVNNLNSIDYINTSNIKNAYDVEDNDGNIFTGPFYKNSNPLSISSDDSNNDFRLANQNNLVDYEQLTNYR